MVWKRLWKAQCGGLVFSEGAIDPKMDNLCWSRFEKGVALFRTDGRQEGLVCLGGEIII